MGVEVVEESSQNYIPFSDVHNMERLPRSTNHAGLYKTQMLHIGLSDFPYFI